jgi:lysophospholipase L1-like esterase
LTGVVKGLAVESAVRRSTGARRLGIKVMTGVLAAGLVTGLGAPEVARAHFADTARSTTTTPAAAGAAGFTATRVMALGDSITRGTGSPTFGSYRMALSERLLRGGMEINYVGSQSNGTGADTEHEGHGGWSIDELSEELDGWLTEARPDVVLVHAGTNNITQGDGPSRTARLLSAMIDQIRAARPDAYIFVAQIIGSRVPRELAQDRIYNRLIPGLVAAKHDPLITVVDQSTVTGIDLHDLHHPNDFGYAKMAWNWYRAMAPVFGTSGNTGANPYAMRSAQRCLATKVVVAGKQRHRTECRTWHLRTVTVKADGGNRRARVWQTLRTVRQAYRLRVGGRMQTRTRLVSKWTGPGNLLDI